MASAFLSYARADSALANRVAKALERDGIQVWNGFKDLDADQDLVESLNSAISAATAMIVLWTKRSVESAWVREEAERAKVQKKLLPAIFDDVTMPLGFSDTQYADLRNWDGSNDHPEWRRLIAGFLVLSKESVGEPSEPREIGSRKPKPAGASFSKPPRARGMQVFVSHASADKGRVSPICKLLMDTGFKIWVDKPNELNLPAGYIRQIGDRRIRVGQDWKEQIRKSVHDSSHVLVFWSKTALSGEREAFHYEVYQGFLQGKLWQARIEDITGVLGYPYRFEQIADLSSFDGSFDWNLEYLIKEIASRGRRKWSWW